MANYDLTYEGSRVQGILDTGNSLKDAGYIFRGEATPSTVPGTPTERVAYIGGPGTYTNFGSSITVGAGCICVFKYTGSAWSNQVINTGLSDAISSEATTRSEADTALQSAITAINNNIGNGYVYAGVATPSTSPVTGKVFYLAVQAGTYTNFGNAVVTAGLNVIKYNGSVWSVDQVIAIDAEPTQGSANLVKSGGVLNSIIQNGPAFDLSAYNAQGGVLATYADLSAALTALNALPADFKKGGMSMKFVLSSDNKYVQCRLMANTFTTDITQWQGVDNRAIDLSKNLIDSDGVFKEVQNAMTGGVDQSLHTTGNGTDFRFINSDGATPSKKYIVYLPQLDLSGLGSMPDTDTIFGIYYKKDSDDVLIKRWLKSEYANLPKYYTFTYPSDAEQLRFRIRATFGTPVSFYYSEYKEEKAGVYPNKMAIDGLNENVSDIYNTLGTFVETLGSFVEDAIELPLTWEAGTIDINGVPSSSSNAYRSDTFIEITEQMLEKLIFTTPVSAAEYAAFVFQYSGRSNDNFISRTPVGGTDNYGKNAKNVEVVLDARCKYIKVAVASYQTTIPLENTITDNCSVKIINQVRHELDTLEKDIVEIQDNITEISTGITYKAASTGNGTDFRFINTTEANAGDKYLLTLPILDISGLSSLDDSYTIFGIYYRKNGEDNPIKTWPKSEYNNLPEKYEFTYPSDAEQLRFRVRATNGSAFTFSWFDLDDVNLRNHEIKINKIEGDIVDINSDINEIKNGITKSVSSTGNGTDFRFLNHIENSSKRGRTLRVYIPTLNLTGVQDMPETNTIFGIINNDGTEDKPIKNYPLSEAGNLPEYYDFVVPDDLVDLRFRVRCTSGSPFTISWTDLDDVNLRDHEIKINNIEAELNKENTIISRNTDKIANIYAGCNAWRGYEPLDKKFALLVFTDLHADANRMNNALYLLDNCEVIDAGLFLGDLEQATAQTETFIPNVAVPAFNAAKKDVLAVLGNHDQRQYANNTITTEASVSRFMGSMTKVSSNYQARGYGYKDFADYKIRIIMLNPYDYPDDKDQNDKCLIFGDIPMYQQAQIDWFISTLNSVPEGYTVLVAAHFVDACVADNNVIPQHINTQGVYNNYTLNRGDNGFQDGSVISDIINAYKNKTALVHSYNYISRTLTQNEVTYNLVCPTPSMPSTLDVNADFSNAEGTFACYLYGHIHKESFCKMSAHNDQIAYGQDASHCWRQSTGYWTSGWSLTPRNKDSVTQDLLNVFCVDTKNKMINVVRIGATTTMFGEKYEVINFSYV